MFSEHYVAWLHEAQSWFLYLPRRMYFLSMFTMAMGIDLLDAQVSDVIA